MGVLQTICLGWSQPVILLISAFHVARNTSVSHQHPAFTRASYYWCETYRGLFLAQPPATFKMAAALPSWR
jgi:hypothetical protein